MDWFVKTLSVVKVFVLLDPTEFPAASTQLIEVALVASFPFGSCACGWKLI